MANSRAVATRSSSTRRTPTTQRTGSKSVANIKPINLRDISGYVNKAIELSANPVGRVALKTIIKQYASSTGIDENVFANAAMHFIDEVRENSTKSAKADATKGLSSLIAGLIG